MTRTPAPRAVADGLEHSSVGESSASRLRTPPLARAARSEHEYDGEKAALLLRAKHRLAGVGGLSFTLAGEAHECDEQARQLLGLLPSFDVGPALLDELMHPDDVQRVRAAIRELCDGETSGASIEFRIFRRADGELRHLSLSAERTPFTDGPAVIAVVKDVSDRVEAEAALAETEERWRSVAINPYDFVALVDREGRFRYVNHVAPGLTLDQVLGHRMHDFIAPEFHAAVERTLARVFEEKKSASFDSYSPATGSWFTTIAGPMFEGEEVVMASLQTHDITDARKATLELQRTARHLKEAQRVAGFGSWFWDPKTDVVEWSEQLYRILGLEPEAKATRELWDELIHPDDREMVMAAERNMVKSGTIEQCEYRIVRRSDRAVRCVRTSGQLLRDDSGVPVGFLGTTLDVTELRELEGQLLHSQKLEAMGRLAGSVAHDFNNLLVVIGFNTDLLLRVGDTRVKSCVQEIAEAADRASKLTRQLLAFARRQVIRPELVDADELLLDLEALVERLVGTDVQLVLELGATRAFIRIDRTQFEQIVLNLAANSRDAMPRGGRLSIRSRELELPQRSYQLSIEDNGQGMDAQTLARAFEPFFTTKPPGQGTGIGLATCQGIVKQLGGTIDVRSTVGSGTCFVVTLPSVDAPAGARRPVDENLPRGSETVLVVETDPQVRRACLRALRALGYGTLSAATIGQALAALDDTTHQVDLLLGDSAMSSGGSATSIREYLRRRPELRVIYTSIHPADGAPFRQENATLTKPFSAEDLAYAVRAALDVNSSRS